MAALQCLVKSGELPFYPRSPLGGDVPAGNLPVPRADPRALAPPTAALGHCSCVNQGLGESEKEAGGERKLAMDAELEHTSPGIHGDTLPFSAAELGAPSGP